MRWTCKSTENLADELKRQNHPISACTVARLLREVGYSLQGNRKTRKGCRTRIATPSLNLSTPACSDSSNAASPQSRWTPKKEKVGDFKNGGQEWFPKGEPEDVRVYDFLIKSLVSFRQACMNRFEACGIVGCQLTILWRTADEIPDRHATFRPRWRAFGGDSSVGVGRRKRSLAHPRFTVGLGGEDGPHATGFAGRPERCGSTITRSRNGSRQATAAASGVA